MDNDRPKPSLLREIGVPFVGSLIVLSLAAAFPSLASALGH
jgi:hypothetical protein